MPSLTVNGQRVTVDDSFDKLSPEDQQATVAHIADQLHDEVAPSGVIAGAMHGASGLASGISSTLGLAGVKSDALDHIAGSTEPKNYKDAPVFRKGGHWYNPSDYNLGNVPQTVAEQIPGLSADIIAGKTGAMVGSKVGGVRGSVVGGIGAGLGSMLLRTFGPGAHANAEARTGDANAPVSTEDMVREAVKQATTAPINATGLGRYLPAVTGKVAGVGLEGGANALKKYLTTGGTEAATGFGRDAVNQAVTNVGQEHGKEFDANQAVSSGITSGVTGATMVAPRAAAETASAIKFRKFGGDNAEAATALANRQLEAAGGKNLIGPLGGTKTAAGAVTDAHADIHKELAAASKGEDLSQDNANTLSRINRGDSATNAQIAALASEASPGTVHLARQAMLSKQLKDTGELTDKKFTGGISGMMEDKLRALYNPVAAGASMAAAAAGLPAMIGLSPHIVAGTYGAYVAARALDKLTGARSPAQGFTDKFGDTNAPIRTPEPQAPVAPPVTTSVPQVSPPQNTALWGNPAEPAPNLRATLNSNAKIDEGMAKIAKQIGDQKRKSMIADAIPALSPIALKMLQQQLKQGLPPTPEPQPAPATAAPLTPSAPVDAFDALKPLSAANVMRKLTAQPEAAAPVGEVSNAPASPAISALMQKLNPTAPPAAPDVAPPVIAKIIKKMGKPMEATPAPEAEQPYAPKPDAELWRKGLSDQEVADKELGSYGPKVVQKYSKNVINKRSELRDTLEAVANAHTPEDAALSSALYHRLDDHSRRADARKAIHHYTSRMSAAAAHAVNSHFTDKVLQRMWKSE
jgi:hypothetical protein